jgi:hypothetical protein
MPEGTRPTSTTSPQNWHTPDAMTAETRDHWPTQAPMRSRPCALSASASRHDGRSSRNCQNDKKSARGTRPSDEGRNASEDCCASHGPDGGWARRDDGKLPRKPGDFGAPALIRHGSLVYKTRQDNRLHRKAHKLLTRFDPVCPFDDPFRVDGGGRGGTRARHRGHAPHPKILDIFLSACGWMR